MDFAKRYKTDTAAEENGKWFPFGGGSQVKVARAGNVRYNEVLRELKKPFDAVRRSQKMEDDEANEIIVKVMARTVLLDWTGFTASGMDGLGLTQSEDGTIPYSIENAEILLREFKDFREEIATLSTDLNNFRQSDEEAVRKN